MKPQHNMNIPVASWFQSWLQRSLYLLAFLTVLFLLVSLLTACQPQHNTEDTAQVDLVPVNPPTANKQHTKPTDNNNRQTTDEQKSSTSSAQNNSSSKTPTLTDNTQAGNSKKDDPQSENRPQDDIKTNSTNTPASQEQQPLREQTMPPATATTKPTAQGTQITKVEYKNQAGQSIKTTFRTSAVGNLQAQITLPSGKKMTLLAPQSGGNNPIYESSDGSIVLVSHSGGGSIELVMDGKSIEFEAISADAEVVVEENQ